MSVLDTFKPRGRKGSLLRRLFQRTASLNQQDKGWVLASVTASNQIYCTHVMLQYIYMCVCVCMCLYDCVCVRGYDGYAIRIYRYVYIYTRNR